MPAPEVLLRGIPQFSNRSCSTPAVFDVELYGLDALFVAVHRLPLSIVQDFVRTPSYGLIALTLTKSLNSQTMDADFRPKSGWKCRTRGGWASRAGRCTTGPSRVAVRSMPTWPLA